MRICCISDTHGLHEDMLHKVPECDVLIHAGDCTSRGELHDLRKFVAWYSQQGGECCQRILVAGNHDWCLEEEPEVCQREMDIYGILYLNGSGCTVYDQAAGDECLDIYGTPIQPEFCNWAFNRPAEVRAAEFAKIPSGRNPFGADILVTHCPPYGVLDLTSDGYRVGCKELLREVRRVKPRLHVFGHIHESYGCDIAAEIPEVITSDVPLAVNASICNLRYQPINKPVVVEL